MAQDRCATCAWRNIIGGLTHASADAIHTCVFGVMDVKRMMSMEAEIQFQLKRSSSFQRLFPNPSRLV